MGDGILKLVERMVPPERLADRDWVLALRDEFNAHYELHKEDRTAPYPGVLDMLDALTARGVAAAVLTNKPDPFARALCRRMFGDRFALVLGQREGRPTKPDQSLTAQVLRETGFTAREAVYLGDSGVDMRTAKNGGVYAVGALWGYRRAEELWESGADAVIKAPGDFPAFFD